MAGAIRRRLSFITASYLELGASWTAKGELDRAIAINNKYVRSARQPGAISGGRQSLIVREGETILNNTEKSQRVAPLIIVSL